MATQVPDQDPRDQYTASAGQTVFPYTFLASDEDDLQVSKNGTVLTITLDYTVSGVGSTSGGDVTFVSPASDGDPVTIRRNMSFDRETDYQDSGNFQAETVNNDFNRLWQAAQELRGNNDFVLQVNQNDDTTDVNFPFYIPDKSDRAGKSLGFDVNGNAVAVDILQAGTSDSTLIFYTTVEGDVTSVSFMLNSYELSVRNNRIYGTDSGAANAYVLTNILGLVGTAYLPGSIIYFVPANNNTGASTVNVEGLGLRDLKTATGGALPSGFLDTSRGLYAFTYTGTEYRFLTCATTFNEMLGSKSVSLGKIADGTANKYLGFTSGGVAEYKDAPKASTLTGYVETSEQSITSDSLITVAHGLGAAPKMVKVFLVCKVIDNSWAVGDELEIGSNAGFFRNGSGTANDVDDGIAYASNSVNIKIALGSNIRIIDAATFNYEGITTSSWRLVARAWL